MRKKTLIILVLLIVLVSILGVSYASWLFTGRQKDFNTLGSKCFELTMMNESEGITLDKTYPISDEEGLSTTGYTFTIKNTCNTYATYEVNLEDMLVEEKRLSGEYIKVSINDGSPINLKELEEKEPTIEESDKAYELTSGSLGPEEETTYTIKLWMDESTPALEETMNATFLSKVSIEAGYIPEENLENEILLNVSSLTESLNNKSEIFEITGTSTNYNLIEYSLDNSHWTRIDEPSKNIVITEEFTEEGKYSIYVRDEVGNIESIEFETTKLDKTVPEIKIEETDNQESIELSIAITDEKSTNLSYAITESKEEPTEWKEYTGEVTYTVVENKNYYIWTKDEAGNVTYQIYSASTIDTKAPELTISNTLTDWGKSDTITIQATDDVIGISGISISTSEGTYNWEVVENTLSYETAKEITENGTYYISVKDAYEHITTKSIVIDKVDNIAPILSDIQNSSNGAWAKSITLSWEITEEESGIAKVEYSTNNNSWNELSKEEWNGLTRNNERNDMLYIRVTDEVGNISNIKSTTMKIDNTIPSATWNIGNNVYGNNGWYQSLSLQSTIKDSYGEINTVRYCTTTESTCTPGTNASISNNTFTVTLGSNASPQKVCTEVIDKAGNTSGVICSSSYSVDTTDPTATISASVSNNTITVRATGSDAHSGIASYQYSRDNSTWYTSTSGTYNFTGLADGNYTLYVKSVDRSGRVSSTVSTTATVAYTNVYVSSNGNDSTGNGSSSRPYATIQTAYNKVASGGTINLMSNITLSETVNISKALTLQSNGSSRYTIYRDANMNQNGNEGTRLFGGGGNITFRNLVFDGQGYTMPNALIEVFGQVVMENVIIQNGYSPGNPGGGIVISNPSAHLTIYNSTITNCTGTGGGGIYVYNGGKLNATNVSFTNNHPYAIYLASTASNFDYLGCTFSGNSGNILDLR